MGRRLCTDPRGRSTDTWGQRRVLQRAYACGLRQRGDPSGERAAIHGRRLSTHLRLLVDTEHAVGWSEVGLLSFSLRRLEEGG